MPPDPPCPCGKASAYAECCRPLHRGERSAETAVALMRSRYAAFALGEVDYLIRTWHPSKRGALDRPSLEASSKELRWLGLEILDVVEGSPTDSAGVVEFEARYATAGSSGVMRERSRFLRVDGAWHYVDGMISDRERPAPRAPGRNEPCACGSGKKSKRCCAGV